MAQVPNCPDCYYNIGYANTQKKDWAAAEAAYKKAIELKADHCAAWTGLANVYNIQNKTDLALEASGKASTCGGGAAGAAGGGIDASGLYNQGVILWNAQRSSPRRRRSSTRRRRPIRSSARPGICSARPTSISAISPAPSRRSRDIFRHAPTGEHADEVKKNIEQLQPLVKK